MMQDFRLASVLLVPFFAGEDFPRSESMGFNFQPVAQPGQMSKLLKQPSSKFILRCPLRIARSTLGFRIIIHCPKQMRTQYATGRSSHEWHSDLSHHSHKMVWADPPAEKTPVDV